MSRKPEIVLLIGAPSTGKTSVLNRLIEKGFTCYEEISREVIQQARKEGYEHLFKNEPLLFSEKLLEGRIKQFNNARKTSEEVVFIDRGLPDITAYMDMVKASYSSNFESANLKYRYDEVFWFPLWKDIHIADQERYEDFELSRKIEKQLLNSYQQLNYSLIEIPKTSVENRVEFILSHLIK